MFKFLSLYKVPLMVAGILLCFAISFGAGWQVHSYKVGYEQNIEEQVTKVVENGMKVVERQHASSMIETQKKLDSLKNNTIIERIPTIVDRPIYLNQCIDEDGAKVLKEYKEKSNQIRQERGVNK